MTECPVCFNNPCPCPGICETVLAEKHKSRGKAERRAERKAEEARQAAIQRAEADKLAAVPTYFPDHHKRVSRVQKAHRRRWAR